MNEIFDYNGEVRKMLIILSKASLENVYAAFVLAVFNSFLKQQS